MASTNQPYYWRLRHFDHAYDVGLDQQDVLEVLCRHLGVTLPTLDQRLLAIYRLRSHRADIAADYAERYEKTVPLYLMSVMVGRYRNVPLARQYADRGLGSDFSDAMNLVETQKALWRQIEQPKTQDWLRWLSQTERERVQAGTRERTWRELDQLSLLIDKARRRDRCRQAEQKRRTERSRRRQRPGSAAA